MRILTSLMLSFAVFFCACTVGCASSISWQPVKERLDFKIDDKAAIIESAFDELRDVYGPDLDTDELKKGKSYVHSIRSDEFKKDILVVMIEDHDQQEIGRAHV